MIGALLKLLREFRRALIKLLVNDPEHGETHRRITPRIKTLAISAHHQDRTAARTSPRRDPFSELRLTQSADLAQLDSRPGYIGRVVVQAPAGFLVSRPPERP